MKADSYRSTASHLTDIVKEKPSQLCMQGYGGPPQGGYQGGHQQQGYQGGYPQYPQQGGYGGQQQVCNLFHGMIGPSDYRSPAFIAEGPRMTLMFSFTLYSRAQEVGAA